MASTVYRQSAGFLRQMSGLLFRLTGGTLNRGLAIRTIQLNKETPATSTTSEEATEEVKEEVDYKALIIEKEELLEEAQNQAADFKDKYVRSLAENENILRRNQKLLAEAKLYAIQSFSKDLLEISDILEKATSSVSEEEVNDNEPLRNLIQGLNMTSVELHKVFGKHGLEKVDPLGEKFDPNFHEALFQIPDPEKEKGSVAIVQKVGYRLHGRTLRPALVGVAQ